MIIKETYLYETGAKLALSAALIYGSKSVVLAVTSREGTLGQAQRSAREHVMSVMIFLATLVATTTFPLLHFTHAWSHSKGDQGALLQVYIEGPSSLGVF